MIDKKGDGTDGREKTRKTKKTGDRGQNQRVTPARQGGLGKAGQDSQGDELDENSATNPDSEGTNTDKLAGGILGGQVELVRTLISHYEGITQHLREIEKLLSGEKEE